MTIVHRRVSMRNLTWLLALIIALSPFLGEQRAAAQSPAVYQNYNVELTLDEQGNLHVRLLQQIRFNGEYSTGFFVIPKDFTTGIDSVQVYAASNADSLDMDDPQLQPLDAVVADEGNEIYVEWKMEQTSPDDVRLFVIEYRALGAARIYPETDQLIWDAIGEDHSGIPVEAMQVTVRLPEAIPSAEIIPAAAGGNFEVEKDGTTIRYRVLEPLPDGRFFNVHVDFPHGYVDAEAPPWQRDEDAANLQLTMDRFDAELTIRPDGTVHVVENLTVSVRAGALTSAFREVRRLYLDNVTNVRVERDGSPLSEQAPPCTDCFDLTSEPRPDAWVRYSESDESVVIDEENTGHVAIDWQIEPMYPGDSATFTIGYDAVGAIRVDEADQLLTWQVSPDYDLPIASVTLRIVPPPATAADALTIEQSGPQGNPQPQPDGSILLTYDGPIPADEPWSIVITLPPDATSASVPAWQTDMEQAFADMDAAAVAAARRRLTGFVAGALAAAVALIGGVFYWLRYGRRRVDERLKGYLAEPPSNLSPGIVAYLVDRSASEKGILASIFHLATAGVISVDLTNGFVIRRLRDAALGATERLTAPDGQAIVTDRHLSYLFNEILLPNIGEGEAKSLDSLQPVFAEKLPELYAQMARDVQQFLLVTPGSRRGRSGVADLASVAFFVFLVAGFFWNPWLWLLAAVSGIVAFVGRLGGRRSDGNYTITGLAETEKWLKFKNYLLNLKEYGDLAAAQQILDRYFAYTVALGVDEKVLEYAEALGTAAPKWMPMPSDTTMWRPRPDERPQTQQSSDNMPRDVVRPRPAPTPPTTQSPSQAPSPRPTLAGMSHALSSSLANASRNMSSLLSTAAGNADAAGRSVVFDSQLGKQTMTWKPGEPVKKIMDDILKQSVTDARQVQAKRRAAEAAARRAEQEARRAAQEARRSRSSSGGSRWGSNWGSGSSSSSRSSGGWNRSSSPSRSSSSRSSSSRSSSSSSSRRSGGGGRGGFR